MEQIWIAIIIIFLLFVVFVILRQSEADVGGDKNFGSETSLNGIWEADLPFLKEANLRVFTVYFCPADGKWLCHFFVEDKNGKVILNKQTKVSIDGKKFHCEDDMRIFPQELTIVHKKNYIELSNGDESIAELNKYCPLI